MMQQEQNITTFTFVPMAKVSRITAKHTLGRLPIATLDAPDCSCGTARRIGYTGNHAQDLAIYRLKVRLGPQTGVTTLPTMYVVDEGKFIDYEEWVQAHPTTLDA